MKGVVADAVLDGEPPGEDRHIPRKRLRRVRVGVLENDAVCGKRVDRFRKSPSDNRTRQMVCPQRID